MSRRPSRLHVLIVAYCTAALLLSISVSAIRAQEKHVPQTAGVDNSKMGRTIRMLHQTAQN